MFYMSQSQCADFRVFILQWRYDASLDVTIGDRKFCLVIRPPQVGSRLDSSRVSLPAATVPFRRCSHRLAFVAILSNGTTESVRIDGCKWKRKSDPSFPRLPQQQKAVVYRRSAAAAIFRLFAPKTAATVQQKVLSADRRVALEAAVQPTPRLSSYRRRRRYAGSDARFWSRDLHRRRISGCGQAVLSGVVL